MKDLPGKRRLFSQNANIWEPEDFADKIYLAEKGKIKIVELLSDGHEILLENVNENDFFGESCFLNKAVEPRKTLARASTACAVVEFPIENFRTLIFQNADLMKNFIVSVSGRLLNIQRRVAILSNRGIEKKLGGVLLYLAEKQGIRTNPPQNDRIKIFVTHGELSDLTAVSRQRITKTMNYFRQAGLLDYQRTKPLVVNVTALKIYLETHG